MEQYERVFPGPRWTLLFGRYDGIEQFAVNELQRMFQFCVPYVLGVRAAAQPGPALEEHALLVGTAADNPLIAQLIEQGQLAAPDRPQGFTYANLKSPWKDGLRVMAIVGADEAGVLYGVQTFNACVLTDACHELPVRSQQLLDLLGDFSRTDYPRIENRGLWTWGYVLYDYRRYLDNMARLRMNILTIWNDEPPLNTPDILRYAHERGIQVLYGFHWGWGLDGQIDLSKPEDRRRIRDSVLERYARDYQHLGLDGIYFQSLTEHADTTAGGKSLAHWVRQLVNETAGALYKLTPGLRIQFGLHATSIRENYVDLVGLDDRIVIVWENVGGTPFEASTILGPDTPPGWHLEDPLEPTIAYSKELMETLSRKEFALVPKGFLSLRWHVTPKEFEHHGPFILGERHGAYIRRRLAERQPFWDRINKWWLANYPVAAEYYRRMLELKPGKMTLTAVVEDGLFEERIQPSVALYGQTIWNPLRANEDILADAMNPYYGNF